MTKKISAIILALVLCLGVFALPTSAKELGENTEVAYEIKLDKESYDAGETVTISLYLYGKSGLEFGTGAIIFGCNSAVFDMAENAVADVKASAAGSELNESYYKAASGSTWAWQTNATVFNNIKNSNTAEENTLFDQYMKYTIARNTSGTHDNAGSNKNGLPADEINADAEKGIPFVSFKLKLRDDIADGTVINVGVPTGAMPKNYCYMNYYSDPGVGTSVTKTTQATSEVIFSTTATVGIPAVHECTPAEAVKENEVAATCSTAGSYDEVVYCSVCKKEISRKTVTVEATGEHVYSKVIERVEPTCVADGYEIKACGCSDDVTDKTILPAIGHNYKSAVTKPTCTDKGYTTYTCSVCNDTYTADEVPAKGHSYREKVTAPTCTDKGYTTFTCPFCKDSYTGNEVPATGHDYKSVVTAPTCTDKGYTTYTCSVCKDSYTGNETEAAGHDYKAVVTAPTCTDKGYTTYTCSACNDTYTDDEVAALGHNYEQSYLKKPTCTWDGYKEFTCSACGDRYKDILPATNHTYEDGTSALVVLEGKPATCTETGKTDGKTCSICNSPVVPQVDIPTVDHTWVKVEVKEPTYTEQGYTVYECSVCGKTKNDDFTDMKPGFDVEIETPASTVVNEGETVTLKAPLTDAPAGFTVEWSKNNDNFTMTVNEDGSISITPTASGTTTFTVTVKDENGEVVSEETIEMTAVVEDAGEGDGDGDEEESWWMKLIKWIINLFKKLIEIIVDLVNSLIS